MLSVRIEGNFLQIKHEKIKGPVNLQIIDVSGRIVQRIMGVRAENKFEVDISRLRQGVYYVIVENSKQERFVLVG